MSCSSDYPGCSVFFCFFVLIIIVHIFYFSGIFVFELPELVAPPRVLLPRQHPADQLLLQAIRALPVPLHTRRRPMDAVHVREASTELAFMTSVTSAILMQ